MSTEMPSSQECKAKAIALIRSSSDLHDLTEQSVAVQAAQVWATLATVPEPLEIAYATLDTTVERPQVALTFNDLPRLPVVRCPHGVIAAIIPDDAGGQESLRYTFALCETCP